MTTKHNTIKKRIRARKVTLSYFYWRIFVLRLVQNESLLSTIVETSRGLENVHDTANDDTDQESLDLATYLTDGFGQDVTDDIDYILSHYFDKWSTDTIDIDYVMNLTQAFDVYYPQVSNLVNARTTSFQFEQMDAMDQAMFVLGYGERKIIQTPKEVIINEIVELAKRYGDGGSPKLLHGIIHHLLTDEQKHEKPGNNKEDSADS